MESAQDSAIVGFSSWITTADNSEQPFWMMSTEQNLQEGLLRIAACLMIANLPYAALPELIDDLKLVALYYADRPNIQQDAFQSTIQSSPLQIQELSTAEPKISFSA